MNANLVAALYLSGEIFYQLFSFYLVIDVFHLKKRILPERVAFFDLHLRRAHHFPALAAFTAQSLLTPARALSLRVRRALIPWRIQTSSCASLRSKFRVL
ncbi:hypothetical protein SEEH3711_11499 [Salmonella enterica subsp. enterica serovar Heidelberg str. 622737-11]|nr:hypothetical protein SEEH3711_11499 [Salmonella enterica subsp. enterica serovar Heidelberg str. 622737-11]